MKIFFCFDCCTEKSAVRVLGCSDSTVPSNECFRCGEKRRKNCPLKESGHVIIINAIHRCDVCNGVRYYTW